MIKNKKTNLKVKQCPNNKFEVKLNSLYVGTYTEEQLAIIKTQINNWINSGMPIEKIQNILRIGNINKEKGDAISKGMKHNKLKQYNKKLPISTINRIKQIASKYEITENEAIIKVVNEFSF